MPRVTEMYRKHGGTVVVDAAGYEGSLIQPLEAAGVPVTKPAARDVAAAFGQFCDAVTDSKSLRHLGQAPSLTARWPPRRCVTWATRAGPGAAAWRRAISRRWWR